MSVREYIGARYVPLFAEPLTWDATRTYEPLTVVLYQGNSYTSRQAVPANTPITNTTYWAQTGNYNAQIEQYRAEVQAFDGRITANAEAISDETSEREVADAELSAGLRSLQSIIPANSFSSVNTVKNYVDNQHMQNQKLCGARVALIGDSWLVGYNGGSTYYGWGHYLENSGYFSAVYKYAQGSAGFIRRNDQDKNFNDAAQQLVTEHGTAKDIDAVIIIGSVNDLAQSLNNIKTGLQTVISTLKTAFPDIPIFVGCNNTSYADKQYFTIHRSVNVWTSMFGAIPITDLHCATVGLLPYFTADQYHLTETGYKFFGANILNYIQSGSLLDCNYYQDLNSSTYATAIGSSSLYYLRLYKTSPTDIIIGVSADVPTNTASNTDVVTIVNDALKSFFLASSREPFYINFGNAWECNYSQFPFLGYDNLAKNNGFNYNASTNCLRTSQLQRANVSGISNVNSIVHVDLKYVHQMNDISLFA